MLCPGPQWKEEAHKRSRKVPDRRGGEVTEESKAKVALLKEVMGLEAAAA